MYTVLEPCKLALFTFVRGYAHESGKGAERKEGR